MVWHEKPHPHWYLKFLSGDTKIRNGGICMAERIALVCEGPSVTMQNMTIEGVSASLLASMTSSQQVPNGVTMTLIKSYQCCLAGLADPVSDLRNALICKGGATVSTLTNVNFKGLGCYVWEDADAVLTSCSLDGGMHGVYAWGRCKVQVIGCDINAMEKSGICIRDGVTLSVQVRARDAFGYRCVSTSALPHFYTLLQLSAPPE